VELLRALGALAEPPAECHAELAALLGLAGAPSAAEHSDLFLLQLYPYASVYLGAEGMLGGEARDRIAGFWRALEQPPPAEADHLTALLALYARLRELEMAAAEGDAARWRHARRALLWEHLMSWLPVWLGRVAEIAPPFYRRWGALLGEALGGEAAELPEPEPLPLHLRATPPLPEPAAAGGEAFLAALLAPARSGVILVRDDLARAGRELGLGLRAGERRWVLGALLGQDAPAVLGWLAGEASRQAATRRRRGGEGRRIAAFWVERAERTADRLAAAARQAVAER